MLSCKLTFAYVLSLLREENEDIGIEKGWKKHVDKLIALIFYCSCKKNYQNLCGLQQHPLIISISMTCLGSDIKVILELHSFLESLKKNPLPGPFRYLANFSSVWLWDRLLVAAHVLWLMIPCLQTISGHLIFLGLLISLSSPVKGSCDKLCTTG